jgi:rSAM/selenodomain-associated transferase 1
MADAAVARLLTVLTRAPSSGGKTRLFASLGMPPDAALLEALLLDTLDGTRLPDVHRIVAVTPPSSCDEVRRLVAASNAAIEVTPQADGDLGERMRAAMRAMFERGARVAALVGSDLPHIEPEVVAAGFECVARDPGAIALGPAADGGYYLLAAARMPEVFDGIAWGTLRVLSETAAAAAAVGFRVHLLDALADVDTIDDLRRAAGGARATRTAAWLEAHERSGL